MWISRSVPTVPPSLEATPVLPRSGLWVLHGCFQQLDSAVQVAFGLQVLRFEDSGVLCEAQATDCREGNEAKKLFHNGGFFEVHQFSDYY